MDDFDSSWFVLRALAGPMMTIITMLIAITIFAPVVLYMIARWRASREPEVDRQLGLKVALHYFAISAFQLGLAGLTLLAWALITSAPPEVKSASNRSALGMIVPAALVLAAHLALLKRTNDARVPNVRRLFQGYNLIITGLLGFIALIIASQALFTKGSSGELGRAAAAMVLIYGSSWAILGWQFGQSVMGSGSGGISAGPHASAWDVAEDIEDLAPPSPPRDGGGSLPSLGDGAFPPIDPRR
jgi:hypothetical protein